jgi:hypothetical protein
MHNGTLPLTRQRFLDREVEILALIGDEPRLSDRNRKQALDYLSDYFDVLRSDAEFEEAVISKCRG